jgi:hypothetical protein
VPKLNRRLFTTLIAATALAAAAVPATALATRPFSPTGPWNTPIPANPQIEPTSQVQITTMSTQIQNQNSSGGDLPAIAVDSYSTPIWPAATTKVPIVISGNPAGLRDALAGGVPFPANAKPAVGSDGHITVLDSANQTLYEFWRATTPQQNADGMWHAAYGGVMDQIDTDPGYFSSSSWSGLGPNDGWNWGATATSLPLLGGLITFEDMRSGVIDHAVAGAWKQACQSYFVYPAQRRDSTGNDSLPTCIPEGARLQLDPAYDVTADNNPPLTKAIERAAQKYGIIVRDRTNDTFSFYGQDPQTEATNPYTSGPGVGGVDNDGKGFFGGKKYYELFLNFPWSKLRIVAARHCTAAPCLP